MTVSLRVSVMRSVERIELPSTRQPLILVRRARERWFMGHVLTDVCTMIDTLSAIHAGDATTATQALVEVSDLYSSNQDFEYAFQSYADRENRKTQYLLRRMEVHKQKQVSSPAVGHQLVPATLIVEHILPKNPGPDWDAALASDPDFRETYTLRLGNMCLLSGVNRSLGNQGFPTKKPVFLLYTIPTAKEAGAASQWNRAAVEQRQAALARLAVATWQFQ